MATFSNGSGPSSGGLLSLGGLDFMRKQSPQLYDGLQRIVVAVNRSLGVRGEVTLVAGAVIVIEKNVTAECFIEFDVVEVGGTQGILSAPVALRRPGDRFTIQSSSSTDTSRVRWRLIP